METRFLENRPTIFFRENKTSVTNMSKSDLTQYRLTKRIAMCVLETILNKTKSPGISAADNRPPEDPV